MINMVDKNKWPFIHRKDRFNDSCCADDVKAHIFSADLEFFGLICPICDWIYSQGFGDSKFMRNFKERVNER